MNQDILQRAMFAMPLSEESRNAGIMQGFEDEMDMAEEDMGDEMMPMERTPQNPEILMNNLRGDMRSVDSRYAELANMVGEEAAMDTPPEVLAILQDHFAMMGQPQGIGALPQGAGVAPPQGMPMAPPPQAMAQAPMPTAQGPAMAPPVGMAQGGIVQNFADGSDEQGVTSKGGAFPADFAKQYRTQAEEGIASLLKQKPETVPTLKSAMEGNIPVYQELLGTGDKDYMKTMMLMDIANRGFAFAANVDPQTGQPLEGSFAQRLGGAARGLPETMMKFLGEQRKEDRAVKVAALEAAQKSIEGIKKRNYDLIETQRKAFGDILKAAGKGDTSKLFGTGQWAQSIVASDRVPRYAAGATTPDEDRLVQLAYETLSRDRKETYKDPVTGQTKTVTIPGLKIPFLEDAIAARAKLNRLNQVSALPGGPAAVIAAASAQPAPAKPAATTPPPAPAEPEQPPVQTGLFQKIATTSGLIPYISAGVSGLPIIGGGEEGSRLAMERDALKQYLKQVKDVFQKARTYTQFEAIEMEKILPDPTAFLTNPENMQFRFVGLDDTMAEVQRAAEKILSQRGKDVQPAKTLQDARDILNKVTAYRQKLAIPRPKTLDEVRALPMGSYFWYEPEQRIRLRK